MTSGLHKLCQPASLAVRKWRENEKKPYNLWQPAWHNETIVKQSFYRKHHLIWNLNNCFPYRSLYKVHQSLIEETLLWSPIQVLVRDSDWSSRIPHFVIWRSFASIIWYSFFWWYIICWVLLFLCQIIFKSPQAYCPTKKVILKHFAHEQVYTKLLNICQSSTINYYFLIYTYDFRSCIFGLSKWFQTYCWKIVYERESMLRVGVISSSGGVHVLINNQQSGNINRSPFSWFPCT